ncbi:MAG TPA: hypothetical protein VHT96_02295 [Clostridia bacterium]|nr:hypothetical protein [Clostridia bacterium]
MNMRNCKAGRTIFSKVRGKSVRRRLSLLLSAALLTVVLSGCTQTITDNADKIARPSNSEAPFFGTWKLESYDGEKLEGETPDAKPPLNGDTVSFAQDRLVYAGNDYADISYKVKRVGVDEYFLHKSAEIPGELKSKKGEILVITVYSKDIFLFELLINPEGDVNKPENSIIASIDDQFFRMRKISDEYTEASGTSRQVSRQSNLPEQQGTANLVRSGILLGVRTPVRTKDGLGDYKYGTYWISCENRTLRPVLYADDIFLPRMDGFWKLKTYKNLGVNGTEDMLAAYKITKTDELRMPSLLYNTSERIETGTRKAIIYVGNDYVCIEKTVYSDGTIVPAANSTAVTPEKKNSGTSGNGTIEILRTLPVDSIASVDGIKISDIAGENGTIAMESALSEQLKNSGYLGTTKTDENLQAKNFALYRKTGHWFFKGRINMEQKEQLPYVDFNLNLIPPADMVAYDVLQVPWTVVKDKLPEAVDIYTSPNKDLAVVLTRDRILLYAIDNKALSNAPLAVYKLADGSSVIMAEWGIGQYVPMWERSFAKNNEAKQLEAIK